MTTAGLTRQMRATVDFIRGYVLEHGYPPSLTEISSGLGLRSKSAANRLIGLLADRGALTYLPGRARSIQLVPASPVLSIELPPHLYADVQAIARKAKVTPEAVVIEAVRDGFKALRSKNVQRETSAPASQEMRARRLGPDTQDIGDRAVTPRG